MNFTWKDIITTILVGGIAWVNYMMIKGVNLPILTNQRWGILLLGIVGIIMCALGSPPAVVGSSESAPWMTAAGVLGVISLILIVVGLITGNRTIFVLLSGTILLLWLVSTTRHMLGK
jgi:hypothetical protein